MKNKIIIGLAALLCAGGLTVQAQTVTNAPTLAAVTNGVSSDLTKLGADLLADFDSVYPLTTNGEATLLAGGGKGTAKSSHWIEALDLNVPLSQTVSVTAIGDHIGSSWQEGGGTLTFSRTDNWPIVGKVTESIGDGGVYDFKAKGMANYLYTQYDKEWDISKRLYVHAGVAVANISSVSGVQIIAGGGLTFHW
jgi:hypothetical protein